MDRVRIGVGIGVGVDDGGQLDAVRVGAIVVVVVVFGAAASAAVDITVAVARHCHPHQADVQSVVLLGQLLLFYLANRRRRFFGDDQGRRRLDGRHLRRLRPGRLLLQLVPELVPAPAEEVGEGQAADSAERPAAGRLQVDDGRRGERHLWC